MHSALYRLPSHATSSVNRVLLRIRPYSLPLGCRSLCTPPPKPSFFTSVSPMRLTFLAFMGVTTYGFIGMVRDEGHDIMAVLRPLLDTSHKAPSEAEVKAKRVAIMEDGIKSARETKPAAKNCFLTIAVNGTQRPCHPVGFLLTRVCILFIFTYPMYPCPSLPC